MLSHPLVIHGVTVPIEPEDVSPIIWARLSEGTYEASEARWAPKAARKGDRILELGTGLGIITSVLAAIQDVQIWSFEADPVTAELAQKVITANCRSNVVLRR